MKKKSPNAAKPSFVALKLSNSHLFRALRPDLIDIIGMQAAHMDVRRGCRVAVQGVIHLYEAVHFNPLHRDVLLHPLDKGLVRVLQLLIPSRLGDLRYQSAPLAPGGLVEQNFPRALLEKLVLRAFL